MSTKAAHLCLCSHTRGAHEGGLGCAICNCDRFRRSMVVRAENAVSSGGHRVRQGARPIR